VIEYASGVNRDSNSGQSAEHSGAWLRCAVHGMDATWKSLRFMAWMPHGNLCGSDDLSQSPLVELLFLILAAIPINGSVLL